MTEFMASHDELKVGQVDIQKAAAPKEAKFRVFTQSGAFVERFLKRLFDGH
jgi:hypothetical protein